MSPFAGVLKALAELCSVLGVSHAANERIFLLLKARWLHTREIQGRTQVQGSDLPKILVKVHAGVSAAVHPRCVGVCSTSLLKNPVKNGRSVSKINLLLTRAVGSIICFLHSKMGAERHKSVETPLFQGSVVELGIVSQSFSSWARHSVQAGFSGRRLSCSL